MPPADVTLYGEDVRGMICCERGRIGDKHTGCYYEALFWQKRNSKLKEQADGR